MVGPNINYDSNNVNTSNIDYAAGWEVVPVKALTKGSTTNVELESNARTVILQPNIFCYISFTLVSTNINTANDLIIPGNSSWFWSSEIKVPRSIVGMNKDSTVWLNIQPVDTSGSIRIVKG